MNRTKLGWFALFFVVTWMANALLSHYIAHDFLTKLPAPGTTQAIDEQQLGRGQGLMLVNLPLFIGLGYFLRAAAPPNPFVYWSLVVLGSTYIPIFLTILLFFTVHAPRGPGQFPGVEIDDGSLEDEKDLDD